MQTYRHINEDYMEEIETDDIVQDNITDDSSDDFFSSMYDVIGGIIWDDQTLRKPHTYYETTAKRIGYILDKFLPDGTYAQPMVLMNNTTIDPDNGEKYKSTKGFTQIQDIPTVNRYYKQITVDFPCIFIIFAFKIPKSLKPVNAFRIVSSIMKSAALSFANDSFFIRNDQLRYYTDTFTSYGIDHYMRNYFSWSENDRTLSNIANTFVHLYDFFRDVMYPDDPYRTALKAIPEFSPAKCYLSQVCHFLHRYNDTKMKAVQETSIIGKHINDCHDLS